MDRRRINKPTSSLQFISITIRNTATQEGVQTRLSWLLLPYRAVSRSRQIQRKSFLGQTARREPANLSPESM